MGRNQALTKCIADILFSLQYLYFLYYLGIRNDTWLVRTYHTGDSKIVNTG